MNSEEKQTVLLLSASAGYGHTKAGESLRIALAFRHPHLNIIHENICDYTFSTKHWSIERVWQLFSVNPFLRRLYGVAHKKTLESPFLIRIIASLFFSAASAIASKYRSRDIVAVVALHPGAAVAASIWRRQRTFYLAVVATDLVVHGFQLLDEVDAVFCDYRARVYGNETLISKNRKKLRYSGLPIERQFFERRVESSKNGDRLAVVTFGAKGLRARLHAKNIIRQLSDIGDLRVHFVCGQDFELKRFVESLVAEWGCADHIVVDGFVQNMSELLHSASLVIGKPGGLTVGEVLAAGKPLLILDVLPGQEEYNRDALVAAGVGFGARSDDLKSSVMRLLASSKRSVVTTFAPLGATGIETIAQHISEALVAKGVDHIHSREADSGTA